MSLPAADPGTYVLVTGASSGIGAEMAKLLAERGHNLMIVARRRERLDELGQEIETEHGVDVTVHAADLASADDRTALLTAIDEDELDLVGVCNCAGIGNFGAFLELDLQKEIGMLDINVTALLELNHALAPGMVARGEGAILNIASLAAFQPTPRLATYGATKAFVQSFSEAFHEELRGTGVSCTVLCPGPVETEWAELAGAQNVMIGPMKIPADQVAKAGVDGMEAGKRSVLPGVVTRALGEVNRHMPRTVLLPLIKRIYSR
ncbi:MAG: uncharacterized protein QOF76_5079 [Solirubrobacteraceae bacterium]|jgi:short-subunit dehydrogenase|nr:uncharacterized protein [Solirubrobacteraceae bacterium]